MPVPPPVTHATSSLIERCINNPPLKSRLEPKCVAVAHDIACARPGEMTADRQRSGSGKPLAHFAARLRRLPLIEIERRRPIQMRHLAGMMKDVAEQDRRLAAALDRDAHMCGTMPRRRNE